MQFLVYVGFLWFFFRLRLCICMDSVCRRLHTYSTAVSLFISPGNKPEAHGVLWKSGGLGESAVLQGQSQLFTAQRAKARDNFHLSTQPVISVSKNKNTNKISLCRSQSLLQTLSTLNFGTADARRSCLGSTRKKLGRKNWIKVWL